MIHLKNAEVLRQLLVEKCHPILVEMILWLLYRYDGIEILGGYRADDEGVHGQKPFRGLDIGITGLKRIEGVIVSDTDAGQLCTHLNSRWIYDPARPEMICAVYDIETEPNTAVPDGDFKHEYHIHLQNHKHTRMR